MIRKTIKYLKKNGVAATLSAIKKQLVYLSLKKYYEVKLRNEPIYANPTTNELIEIESSLHSLGIPTHDYYVDKDLYQKFNEDYRFPEDYHGGIDSGVWHEKILEHYVAWDILKLAAYEKGDIYIDVAACGSPWAHLLKLNNINSYAIDLEISDLFSHLPYYKKMDATNTDFHDNSVAGISLQCAFEMFIGDSDKSLINELARILKPGGHAVISPLYMHTQACHYATPEYYGKGYGDADSKEYLRTDTWGVPASRKYDANKLKARILDLIKELGMSYKIFVLKNRKSIHQNVYLHYVLVVTK